MEKDKTIILTDVANVIDTLGLKVLYECKILEDWEQSTGKISEAYQEILEEARIDLFKNGNQWNEEELKMNFVSIVLRASNIEIPQKMKVFYERPLSGKIQEYKFSIICDCMVASPTEGGCPQTPYFFLQEFKKGKGDKIDAEAQTLIAMLLAQEANQDTKPLFGAWLMGENWYFMVLNGKEYCLSRQYVASNAEDLQKIVYMLQALRNLVE